MAKPKRMSNPLRLSASTRVVEQRCYDEAYGPSSNRHYARGDLGWEEDPAITAVDIRLSAESQARENVCEFLSLEGAIAAIGFTASEVKELLSDVYDETRHGDWLLSSSETNVNGNYRKAIREARQRAIDGLLDHIIDEYEADLAREGVTPV